MVQIYIELVGPNWNDKSNWLVTPITDWFGVTVTNNRVTGLDLYSNGLVRDGLPSSIVNLTALEYLDLGYNNFLGTIPSSYGELTSLKYLYLGGNDLEGSIPVAFSNLSDLKVLYVENNRLSGNIPSFFSNLEMYNVTYNQFVFADFANIIGTLGHNDSFYGGEVTIGQQTSLSLPFGSELYIPGYSPYTGDVFQWYRNGVPISGKHVDNFSGGTYHCVVNNPSFLGLTLISLPITVTVTNPYNISNTTLNALWKLWVSTGGVDGIWTNDDGWFVNNDVKGWYGIQWVGSAFGMVEVFALQLDGNNLTGIIPAELGNLNLWQLWLQDNNLTGNIPSELGNISLLRGLSLYNNSLTGSIPPELGNLSNLYVLYLHGNSLTGVIPSDLGYLLNLQHLLLNDNYLTGTIPSTFGNLLQLRQLWLYSNLLTGTIPQEFEYLTNLDQLLLFNNSLTGVVHECICNIGYTRIKGGNNSFSDPYPSCWSTLKSATIEKVGDPTEILESCIDEAMKTNIDVEAFSDYIHNCMADKMKANQVIASAEKMLKSKLKAFPNPAKTILNIDVPFGVYQARLFDFSGRVVLDQQCCGNEVISVSHLNKGIYMLIVESEGEQEIQKITIE